MRKIKRVGWIDSCRFFAIFVIMFTHFLSSLRPDALRLWELPPGRYVLGGLTGKLSVAFFFVLLGYFASAPRRFTARDFGRYCLHRYTQFSFFVFVTTLLYIAGSYGTTWVFHTPDEAAFRVISDGFHDNLVYLLRDSFLYEDSYNATLWCMQQLFLASVLCRLLAYLPERLSAALRFGVAGLLILLLMLLDSAYCVWIAVAVLGYLLRLTLPLFDHRPALKRPLPLTLLFLLAVACIKAPLPESPVLYSLQGVGSFLLLLVLFHTPFAQHLLSASPFPWLGGVSMGLFVVHTPLNSLLFSVLGRLLPMDGSAPLLLVFLLFFVSFFLCVLCAWLLHRLYAVLIQKNA